MVVTPPLDEEFRIPKKVWLMAGLKDIDSANLYLPDKRQAQCTRHVLHKVLQGRIPIGGLIKSRPPKEFLAVNAPSPPVDATSESDGSGAEESSSSAAAELGPVISADKVESDDPKSDASANPKSDASADPELAAHVGVDPKSEEEAAGPCGGCARGMYIYIYIYIYMYISIA